MQQRKQHTAFAVDGYAITASFADCKNAAALNHVKQILLSSFANNTVKNSSGDILAIPPEQRDNNSGGSPYTMEAAQVAYDEGQAMLDTLNAQYDDIISWADMYDSASMESKKMIVSCLIRRVEVYRDYRLHIDFNIDFEQFSAGLDISAIAA